MKRYLTIYLAFLKTNLHQYLIDRGNFGFNVIVGYSAWSIFSVFIMYLLTLRVTSLYGWSRGELLVLVGYFNIFVGLFDLFLSKNFEAFFILVHTGQLDNLLVKPIDSQFLISTQKTAYASLIRLIFGIIVTVYFIISYHTPVTLASIFISIILLLVAMILLYSVWFIATTLAIWNPRLDNIIDILFTSRHFLRYPREMYLQLNPLLFLIILPLTFVLIPSTKALLGKSFSGDMLGLIGLALLFFLIARYFLKFALRSYTSASS